MVLRTWKCAHCGKKNSEMLPEDALGVCGACTFGTQFTDPPPPASLVTDPALRARLDFFPQHDGTTIIHLSQGLETVGPVGGRYKSGDAADARRLLLEMVDVITGEQGKKAGWNLP